MIIINIKGGLGNQMFQYAFGRALSIKNNDDLKLDISSLDKAHEIGNIYRPFSLNLFKVKKTFATKEEVSTLKKPESILKKIKNKVVNTVWGDQTNVFKPQYLAQSGDLYLDGYWQSPLFFDDIRETLISEFTLENSLPEYGSKILKMIQENNSISIHIRRGDYVNNPRVRKEAGLCSNNYYQLAINKLISDIERPIFFIFSDDINWVKNNLNLPEETVFVSNSDLKDAEELILMSSCQHNIIANSSFSWWAAYLNQNADKIVVAPTPWFDTISYDPHLLPSSWIKIPKK